MSTVVLGALWALWPIAALTGGLAYSVLSALAALIVLPFVATSLRIRLYSAALLAFFVYAGVSSTWSPRDQVLVEFDFVRMQFAVRSEMLRVGLQILAQGLLIAAALRLDSSGQRRVQAIAHVALTVQLAALVVLTLFEQQILAALTALVPDTGEGVQNISRNSLIMAVSAPLLAIRLLQARAGWVMGVVVLLTVAGILAVREVNAGLLAMAAAAGAIAVVHILPRHGFKVLAGLIALLTMSAPWVFGFLSQGADFATAGDSSSYRAAIWQRVISLIEEQPLIGHGLGSLRTVRETIETGVFAGQFTIPNHAHNMMLQLWAETGAIGAGLVSLAIMLAGWRIPGGANLGVARLRGAALVGAMTAIAAVSFDLWNEWWWAVGGLLAVLAVATPRLAPENDQLKRMAEGVENGAGAPPTSDQDGAEHPETGAASTAALSIANNFNLVRLILALMVVVYHVIVLPGLPSWQALEGWASVSAEVGVQGFFVLSGYLVWASLERTKSLGLYAEKRARRILPGYVAVIVASVVAALLLVPAVQANLADAMSYLGWNLIFLNFMHPVLPGVFEANRFIEINGALWTLKIEVLFYLILPVLAWMLRAAGRWRWVLFLLIYVSAEVWRFVFEQGDEISRGISRQLPGQMSFFITGIALSAWRADINWRSMLAPLGLVLLAVSVLYPEAEFVRAAGVGIVAIWLSVGLPRLFDAARFGDLSYGLYIVHFPIIQCVVAAGIFAHSPELAIGIVAGACLTAAMLLWWLVERPALRRDSAYRAAA